jgi:AraC-like DNA-binding protein
MSSSSLRSKFRQAYGCSVFDYLRDCRLARARGYLLEGYSVQQAAWMSGYQHATNFSTAFVGATASRPAMCKSRANPFFLFLRKIVSGFGSAHTYPGIAHSYREHQKGNNSY